MFQIVIPVLNQHWEAVGYIDSWFVLAKGKIDLLIIDNGSDEPFENHPQVSSWRDEGRVRVIRNDKNVGVYPTFQQGFDNTTAPFIFYSHSDVQMVEHGWDEKLKRIISELPNVGVCGMFGATGIGTPHVYRSPYHFSQLRRWDCHTVQSMAGAGGSPLDGQFKRVMVLDGFSLIVNRSMLEKESGGRFDHKRYPVHHMYDNDICLESHFWGYRNYVIDIDCIHHGGMTSTREKWAEAMGTTDLAIHRKAHRIFYEKWRGKLPVSVQ